MTLEERLMEAANRGAERSSDSVRGSCKGGAEREIGAGPIPCPPSGGLPSGPPNGSIGPVMVGEKRGREQGHGSMVGGGTCGKEGAEAEPCFLIGYALSAKKAQSFLRPDLFEACRQKNVIFLPIDRSKTLSKDSPSYDAILHKDSSPEWVRQLDDYSTAHPDCILIDDPRRITPLHNRVSMLECVDDGLLSALRSSPACQGLTLKVPQQVSVTRSEELAQAVEEGSVKFPLVAKPLVADGSAESHKMFLVLNAAGMEKLRPPLVVQEFINHGGVIFKVYVVGESSVCTPRKSLPDCNESNLDVPEGLVGFSQISNLQNLVSPESCQMSNWGSISATSLDTEVELSTVQLPSDAFVRELSTLLREKLRLTLFNYDLIQDTKTREYYIVDINYFPGFAKMPDYVDVLSNYFAGLAKRPASSGS